MPYGRRGSQQNPFDMLRNLGDLKDIKKLLGPDFFKNLPMYGGEMGNETPDGASESFPPVDLYDSGGELVLWVSIPGVNRADISLQVSPFHVVIRGNIPSNVPKRDERLLIDERYYGPFEREIELPNRVHTDTVRANFSAGVLKVTLVKYGSEEAEFNQSVPINFDEQR